MNRRKFIQYLSVGAATLVVGGAAANSLVDNPTIGNEGLLAQINRAGAVMDYDVLTYEKLEGLIEDLMVRDGPSIAFEQSCKTNGFVMRSDMNPNICNDPSCLSCRELSQALRDIGKIEIDKL